MSARAKILNLTSACTVGGCEAHVLALLGGLDRARYEPWLAYFEERPDDARPMVADFQALGVRTVDLQGHRQLDPVATWRLAQLVRRESFALIHAHSLRAELAAVLVSRLNTTRPRVLRTFHNTDHHDRNRPASTLARLSSLGVDHVIAISDAVAAHVVEHVGVSPGKLRRIHYGLDPKPFLHVPLLDRERRQPTIGMIARLAPQKGHTTLLDALPAVVAQVPDLRVELVGHEHLSTIAELRRYADRRGLRNVVTLAGYRDDVAALLSRWDALVLPSHWEGFGLVLLEAMAAARPVVASRVGPIPEIVLHGETGILVEPGRPDDLADGILTLLMNPELALAMGVAGRRRVMENFSLERMVAETDLLYCSLLSSRVPGAPDAVLG